MGSFLEENFEKMGARIRVRGPDREFRAPWSASGPVSSAIRLDVKHDRQGEFFDVQVNQRLISLEVVDVQPHDEPLRRGAGKPHLAEACVRMDGRQVYVSRRFPKDKPGIALVMYIQGGGL